MTYQPKLGLIETEKAIKYIKDTFERTLAKTLNLTRVSAPLFVLPETGLNDHLNGYERAVTFDVLALGKNVEIVQSLAKWKRMALQKYGFQIGEGLYTDMNAIRRDETLDPLHSIYVDQWDWEKIIEQKDRTIDHLKQIVTQIYAVIYATACQVSNKYPVFSYDLPPKIVFITTKELEEKYPTLSPKERENAITKQAKAVFIMQIGWPLTDGKSHDGRAADYDDWTLNGDILLWYEPLNQAMELSSMGIRVDQYSLLKQLQAKNEEYKLTNPFVTAIINRQLPLTIGGGIGQSRLCMYFLQKQHIGEVQASIWSDEILQALHMKNIHLL